MTKRSKSTVNVNGKEVKVGDLVGFKVDTEQYAAIEAIHVNPWGGRVSFTVTSEVYDEEEEYVINSEAIRIWASDCWFD